MSHAHPARIDATRKTPMPKSMTGLRPKVSASFEYTGTVTDIVSR